MKRSTLLILAVLLLLPSAAWAEWYAGLAMGAGYGAIDTVHRSNPSGRDDFRTIGLRTGPTVSARIGGFFERFGGGWLGGEIEVLHLRPQISAGRIGGTNQTRVPAPIPAFIDSPIAANLQDATLEITAMTGSLMLRTTKLFDVLQPYVGMGGGYAFINADNFGFGEISRGTGVFVGTIGTKLFLTDQIALSLEWKNYLGGRIKTESGWTGDLVLQSALLGMAYHWK
jgi:hypothetical protein